MKTIVFALAGIVLCASASLAAKEKSTAATVVSMQSVECGAKKSKKSETPILCHQYVVRTASTEYQIRQRKSEEETVVPANTAIEFTLNKNKMKFKVDGKNYEYIIVGTSAISASDRATP